MKLYLAAKYAEAHVMRAWRDVLHAEGHAVTARWIDGAHDMNDLGEHDAQRTQFAEEDLEDIENADCLILWNPLQLHGQGRGGRHVEFGYAIARGKRIVIVGDRENVFHYLGEVHVVPTVEAALGLLSAMQMGAY